MGGCEPGAFCFFGLAAAPFPAEIAPTTLVFARRLAREACGSASVSYDMVPFAQSARMLACAASPGRFLSIDLSCTILSPIASVFGLKPSARKPCDALAQVRILRGGRKEIARR